MRSTGNVIHHGGFRDPEATARNFILGCIPSITAEQSAASVLRILGDTVENLIELLDELMGDPDLEPNAGNPGQPDEREPDDEL
jgi:hypothetical protein